jgi:hypothetical protein
MPELLANASPTEQIIPALQLPDASSARNAVKHWLLKEIGQAVYPGDAEFIPESFTWHIPVWLSYAGQTKIAILADIYLHAATGAFIGRPSREDLIGRAEALLKKMDA